MRRMIVTALTILILTTLAACNTPRPPEATPTPTIDLVATQVSNLMTAMPTPTVAQPTPTLEPSPTPQTATATDTPPAPTASATLPGSGELKDTLGAASWSETFEQDTKAFYKFESDETRVTQENGALVLSGLQGNGWLGWSLTFSRKPHNFYVEATFTTQSCSGSDLYGLVFRAPNTNAGYFYGVTCDGRYNLRALNFDDGSETDLIELGGSDRITSGSNQSNRLGVLVNGQTIGLYANGQLLQEVSDSTFTEAGNFGAFIAANQTVGFTVRMEEIHLWDLP